MTGDYEFTISLRIRHPGIDPAEITRTLSIEPQHTWRAGDARRSPTGEPLEGTHRESYWMGRLMDEPQISSGSVTVESTLLQTLTQLRRSQDLLAGLSESGGESELHVSLFAWRAFRLELSPESLASLGKLGLGLTFEVHPPSPSSP